jgi:D-lactate dehydrogenase
MQHFILVKKEYDMKILFFECEPWQEALFCAHFKNDQLFFYDKPLRESSIPNEHRDAEIVSIFTCSCITKKIADQFPQLKLVVTRSTGFDHVDLTALKERKIAFSNIAHYADRSVAEYVFALLFNLARKINLAIKRTSNEHSFSLDGLRGFDLFGKTIGVIGTGNIGSNVIKIAHCLGMKTVAFDISQNETLLKEYGTQYLPLEKILQISDVISLHVPLTEKTFHIINKRSISQIKKGAYIINTARGAIIETDALVQALEKNIIAGAALDVLEEECFTQDPLLLLSERHPSEEQLKAVFENNYLLNHPNVIITPHNAFNSKEALERLMRETISVIEKFKKSTST